MFKKLKSIDDLILAKALQIMILRDQQIINNNKINLGLKAQIKKAKEEK